MGKKLNSEEQIAMIEAIRSFGYSTIVIKYRIFCLAPGDETIYVIRKLKRDGFWELNQVDRFMWEKYGAMGYPLRPFICTAELLEFLYCHAAMEEGIRQGLVLQIADAFRQTNYETSLERLNKRMKELYLSNDINYARKKTKAGTLKANLKMIEERKKLIQEALDGGPNEHYMARRKMIAVMEKYGKNDGTDIRKRIKK